MTCSVRCSCLPTDGAENPLIYGSWGMFLLETVTHLFKKLPARVVWISWAVNGLHVTG